MAGAVVYWCTGLSGAGKTTLALAFRAALRARGRVAHVIDGDELRWGLNADLGFSPADRAEATRRAAHLCRALRPYCDAVVVSLITPLPAYREAARAIVPGMHLVHVACPLETCIARDPKGLYRAALAGEIAAFTGVSAPYVAPAAPELTVDSARLTVAEGARLLADHFEAAGVRTVSGTERGAPWAAA